MDELLIKLRELSESLNPKLSEKYKIKDTQIEWKAEIYIDGSGEFLAEYSSWGDIIKIYSFYFNNLEELNTKLSIELKIANGLYDDGIDWQDLENSLFDEDGKPRY